DRSSPLLPDLSEQFGHYLKLLDAAMTRGRPQHGGPPPSLAEWFDMLDAQARAIRQWQALFADYDAVIAPVFGTTAYPHDPTPVAERRLKVDGADTSYAVQLAFPGIANFANLPATAVPIGTDADGLPIGAQVIADLWNDHKAIRIARLAH